MTPVDPARAELFIESGPGQGESYSLSALASQTQGLLIGRFSTCDVRFPASARMIGREHARIVSRPDGVFLLGLHQNGSFIDGTVVGKDGQLELRYGARIQLGEEGPVLLLRERQQQAPPISSPSKLGTVYEAAKVETAEDLRAEIDALKAANRELDRQNTELRVEKETLSRQLQSAGRSSLPSPAPPPTNDQAMAMLQRFSQGLLGLQKMLSAGQIDSAALLNKLELIIFDMDELHSAVSSS